MARNVLWVVVGAAVLCAAGTALGVLETGAPANDNREMKGADEGSTSPDSHSGNLATDGGGSMTMSVPVVGTMLAAPEAKDHFTMPPGIKKVTVEIGWEGTGWGLDVSIGTGDCPENGTALVSQNGATAGPLTLDYKAVGGGSCEAGQWFIWARCNDPNDHRGESLTFSYSVTTHWCG